MPSAYSIPKIYEDEIDGAVAAGYYSNKSEVVRDALRLLFETKDKLRVSASVQLYKLGKVSLARAAELAGVTTFEFKDILADNKIRVLLRGKSSKEAKNQLDLIKKTRSQS